MQLLLNSSVIKSQCINVKIPITNKYIPNILVEKKSGHSPLKRVYTPISNNITKKPTYKDPVKNILIEAIILPAGPNLHIPKTAIKINNIAYKLTDISKLCFLFLLRLFAIWLLLSS